MLSLVLDDVVDHQRRRQCVVRAARAGVAGSIFFRLQAGLLTRSNYSECPGYGGRAFQRRDASVIGIRESEQFGTTIDVLKSIDPRLPRGFKVHQR